MDIELLYNRHCRCKVSLRAGAGRVGADSHPTMREEVGVSPSAHSAATAFGFDDLFDNIIEVNPVLDV